MLGGIDPIIIFHRYKKVVDPTASVGHQLAIVSKKETFIPLTPIPIYLSEAITGVQIDSESKNLDVETDTQTLSDGTPANSNQKGINSGVSVTLSAKKDSIGVSILSAFMDDLFDKVTSKEYAITYIHGATTIFQGLLHTFAVDQNSGTDLLTIKFELSKGQKQPTKPPPLAAVPSSTGTLPLIPGAA